MFSFVFYLVLEPLCYNHAYIGDGYCDDDNNNDVCNYDGGDCCLDHVLTDWCTICICIEDNPTTVEVEGSGLTTTTLGNCITPLIGDGYCDDENNQEACSYDNGDCCLAEVQTLYCDICICNETGLVHTTTATTSSS